MARQKARRLPGLATLVEDRVQRVVAERLGIHPVQFSRIVTQERGAAQPLIGRIAAYFGTTEEALTGEAGLDRGSRVGNGRLTFRAESADER